MATSYTTGSSMSQGSQAPNSLPSAGERGRARVINPPQHNAKRLSEHRQPHPDARIQLPSAPLCQSNLTYLPWRRERLSARIERHPIDSCGVVAFVCVRFFAASLPTATAPVPVARRSLRKARSFSHRAPRASHTHHVNTNATRWHCGRSPPPLRRRHDRGVLQATPRFSGRRVRYASFYRAG